MKDLTKGYRTFLKLFLGIVKVFLGLSHNHTV